MIRGFSSLITVLLSTSSLSGDKRRTRNRRLSIASLEDRVAPAADLISRKRRYIDAVQRKNIRRLALANPQLAAVRAKTSYPRSNPSRSIDFRHSNVRF